MLVRSYIWPALTAQCSASEEVVRVLVGTQDEDSESAQKLAEAEWLRQAEKFMVVGTGEATCMGCGYEYQPKNGDPEYPITPGTYFSVRPVFIIQLFIQGVVCADVASHTQTTA